MHIQNLQSINAALADAHNVASVKNLKQTVFSTDILLFMVLNIVMLF